MKGSTFVICQYWTSSMFTKEVVGTANVVVGGWGNLGGGVTQLVMGSMLFPLFKTGMSAEQAWRTVNLVPTFVGFCTGILTIMFADDAPKGNYKEMKKWGTMAEVSAQASFRSGATNINSWLLFIQYACCFGVELTMNNAAASYFKATFELSTESAAAIASLFGWMNLFTRGLGGFFSDKANAKYGMRGRLWTQAIFLLGEGIMVLIFAHTKKLGLAIFVMVIFSSFVQAAEGSSFGIVPYIDPPATGINPPATGFALDWDSASWKPRLHSFSWEASSFSLVSPVPWYSSRDMQVWSLVMIARRSLLPGRSWVPMIPPSLCQRKMLRPPRILTLIVTRTQRRNSINSWSMIREEHQG